MAWNRLIEKMTANDVRRLLLLLEIAYPLSPEVEKLRKSDPQLFMNPDGTFKLMSSSIPLNAAIFGRLKLKREGPLDFYSLIVLHHANNLGHGQPVQRDYGNFLISLFRGEDSKALEILRSTISNGDVWLGMGVCDQNPIFMPFNIEKKQKELDGKKVQAEIKKSKARGKK
jgi:hypothetical protein